MRDDIDDNNIHLFEQPSVSEIIAALTGNNLAPQIPFSKDGDVTVIKIWFMPQTVIDPLTGNNNRYTPSPGLNNPVAQRINNTIVGFPEDMA